MHEPTKNGSPEEYPEGELSTEGSVHMVWRDDDPDAIVEVWPNCKQTTPRPPLVGPVPETAEEELLSLMSAVSAYKHRHGLESLLWRHVLDVLHDMGYRKVLAPAEVAAPTSETRPA